MLPEKFKYIALWSGLGLFMLLFIGFVEKKSDQRTCKSIIVNIDDQYENYFLNENDITDWVTNEGDDRVIGERLGRLNLGNIERRLEERKFVEDAQVYKDLKRNIIVNILQSRPVARLVGRQVRDRYISSQGEVLPTSDRYTARVLLITGPWVEHSVFDRLTDSETGAGIFHLIRYIRNDPFWNAQIAELNIAKNGDIDMYTQVSKQRVEFGKAEDIDIKFKKLKIFYKQILPAKGWNTYSRVSLKYSNQIVCE